MPRLVIYSIIILAVALLFMVSCATYYGHTPEPKESTDSSVWLAYYRGQFRAYGDSTLPPKDNYDDSARQAYTQARKEWEDSQGKALIAALIFSAALTVAVLAVIENR
jgi:hypothetical protein